MKTINVEFIHPTNNSAIGISLPRNIILRDVINQLIDADFLDVEDQPYEGLLKLYSERKESVKLDNDKTVMENGIKNSNTIQILIVQRICFVCLFCGLTEAMSSLLSGVYNGHESSQISTSGLIACYHLV